MDYVLGLEIKTRCDNGRARVTMPYCVTCSLKPAVTCGTEYGPAHTASSPQGAVRSIDNRINIQISYACVLNQDSAHFPLLPTILARYPPSQNNMSLTYVFRVKGKYKPLDVFRTLV